MTVISQVSKNLHKLWREETGQGMVEYALILALISLVVVGALSLMGEALGDFFESMEDHLNVN